MPTARVGQEIPVLAALLKDAGYEVTVIDPLWKMKVNNRKGRERFAETVVVRHDVNDIPSFYWDRYATKISDVTDFDKALKAIHSQLSVTRA
jgi:hypothetical protein